MTGRFETTYIAASSSIYKSGCFASGPDKQHSYFVESTSFTMSFTSNIGIVLSLLLSVAVSSPSGDVARQETLPAVYILAGDSTTSSNGGGAFNS